MVRRESATALVAESETEVESTVRGVLLDAAVLFYQAVYAGERVRLLAASVELTRSIADVTDRRYRAGDLAILDVHVASAALARAQADHQAALAEQTTALGQLRALLNVSEPLTVQGSLAPVSPPDMAMLTAMVEERADIRALQATIRSAEADLALARTLSKPDYGFGMRVSREGPDRLVLGGATISWPVFSKGQEQVATGLARLGRLRAELDAVRARARIELQASLDAYAQRRAAALMLDDTALPGLEDVAALTTRSFDVGQIGIADVLVMRRELNETQMQALAARLEVAKARVTVDAMAGVLR
jgi:cobalt-zinc-cadmium efflux system outer membrane protein